MRNATRASRGAARSGHRSRAPIAARGACRRLPRGGDPGHDQHDDPRFGVDSDGASGSLLHQRPELLILKRAGLDPADAAKYELDHFVPLALGGHPRSEDNLWLQPWLEPGAQRSRIDWNGSCRSSSARGSCPCAPRERAIQNGWKDAYRKLVGAMPRAVEDDEEEVVD
jgi:hypothetical protein